MQDGSAASVTTEIRGSRAAQIIRALVLVVVGLGVTFTATLHEQLAFDRTMLIASLCLIGAATIVEYFAMRGTAESWWIVARATVAFAAGGAMIAAVDNATFALIVTLWAALTGVITFMRLVRGVQPRRVAVPSLLLSFALAVAALIFREDPVAVIGFFGAYAMIRGVFLGISAFDPRPAGPSPDAADAAADEVASTREHN